MTESDNKRTAATSQSTTSAKPEKLSERQADPELLALHGIAGPKARRPEGPKATLEALRNRGRSQ